MFNMTEVEKNKFGRASIRNVYKCIRKTGLYGNLVLKSYRRERIFSLESHTRKVVQMPSLARYLTRKMKADEPPEFGNHLLYTELYYGKVVDE